MNKLQFETSPYLLQHANNPINWNAWSENTLEIALETNQLIIVSIGYSTCHWCHVMEKETFEDLDVAEIMNKNFISIKVDREERPDIDSFYMKAIQLITKQGGWPLNVVCLPDGRPIWGGTYFTKQEWKESLIQLHEIFSKEPKRAYEFAEELHKGIIFLSKVARNQSEGVFDLDKIIEIWKENFDMEYGGLARTPKFMMPNNLLYLQKLGVANSDKSILKYIDLTLTKMAWGGIFDTVDGGFSRYSVDNHWHIPHFEKMLYDNAQLLSVYADGYKRTQNYIYKKVIEKTISFIEESFHNKEGAYFSAFDADSLNKERQLKEGAYYTWTKEELEDILKSDYHLFSQVFNINSYGLWEDSQYILIQTERLEDIAIENHIPIEDLLSKKEKWENKLKEKRKNRSLPRLDDKTLTSWNALLAIGLIDAYSALKNEEYLEKAEKILSFIETKLWDEEKGLFHTYKNGKASIAGFLEDYAIYANALISLYEITLKETYLQRAKNLTDYTLDHFFDTKENFFKFSSTNTDIFVPSIEIEDNVIPSSNSFMAHNLYKLGILYENTYYNTISQKMLFNVLNQVDYASAFSNWLLLLLYSKNPKELSIVGKNAKEKLIKIKSTFISKTMVFGCEEESKLPYFSNKYDTEQTLYYFCNNKLCLKPESQPVFLKKITL